MLFLLIFGFWMCLFSDDNAIELVIEIEVGGGFFSILA